MAIQPRGHKTYLIKITLGYEPATGKRLYYTETFKGTKKEAELREAELKIKKRDKKLVLSSGMTFRECFNLYCEEARLRLSLNCFNTYESFVKCNLLPSIGGKKIKELVNEDFQRVYDSMRVRGLSPSTIHTLHTAAKAVITWAMKKKVLGENILENVALPKIPKPRPEFLTYRELRTFFRVAPNYWYGNAFKFQFLTGLRNQELMALMWDDINFETDTVLISRACVWIGERREFKGTKTGVERTLELDERTIKFLKRLKVSQEKHIRVRRSLGLSYGDERLVFCTKDGRVPSRRAVSNCFKAILKKAGITRRFRWYGIRHTHATHMLDIEGANPKMIANRMGHSVEMLFRTYGHEMRGQQREASSKISSRLDL